MEGKKQEDWSVRVPLLVGNGDVEEKQKSPENQTGTASFFSTFFNGLNALSGVGILSTPYALASGGWLSLILLFVVASSSFYTGLLIKRCMDADPTIASYPDIGHRAFGKTGKAVVSIVMNVELYLVATGFLILEGDNLGNMFQYAEIDVYGARVDAKKAFVVVVALVILPTIWVDNMSVLSYVSASGVLASVIILGSIVWVGALDGVGFHENGELVKWSGAPSAVSLYAFCYCAHPVFPTLYTSMKNRRQFSNVLLLCFGFCTFTYAFMAVIGYLMFGPAVESQITLNLPTDNVSSWVAICTTLVNPIAKYALMVTPIINSIESRFKRCNGKGRLTLTLVVRTALVLSTVVVALAVPFFGSLMSLVGAFLSAAASITLPCLCYLKISGMYRRMGLEPVVIGLIVVLGLTVAVVGTYTSVVDIVGRL